jgi:hypothetical protein
MLDSSCLRSALRLVVGRLSFTRHYVPRSTGSDRPSPVPPATSRWSPGVSHFFDVEPSSRAGRGPLHVPQTVASEFRGDRLERSAVRSHWSPFVHSSHLLHSSSFVGPFGRGSSLVPETYCPMALSRSASVRSLNRCAASGLAASPLGPSAFEALGLADLPLGLPGNRQPHGLSEPPLGLITRDHSDRLSALRGAPSADHVPLRRKDQPLGRD